MSVSRPRVQCWGISVMFLFLFGDVFISFLGYNGPDCYRRTGETYKNNRRTTVEAGSRGRRAAARWDGGAAVQQGGRAAGRQGSWATWRWGYGWGYGHG